MEFLRPKKLSLGLDLAPLIDVVFQLLIFFMLSSSFLTPALKLRLPTAVTQDQREKERIIVSIDKTGNIFLNSSRVSLVDFRSQLQAKLASDPNKSIHLRGDREISYRLFVEVMDLARQAGARQINIVHESKSSA